MERFYLQMHITNKCHGKCNHCYQESYNGEDMVLSQAILVIKELSQICKKIDVESHISITGGDPLMAKDFLNIVSFARNNCDRVSVLGNPELLTDEMITKLATIGINNFQLSLDGLPEVHDKNRYPGSFFKTHEAIKRLSVAGIPVNISMTLLDNNRNQVNEIKKISKKQGAHHLGVSECVPNGKDCDANIACSLGSAVMTILPDLTLMACRRVPSSVLGRWTYKNGLEHHFVHNPKMIFYRERR